MDRIVTNSHGRVIVSVRDSLKYLVIIVILFSGLDIAGANAKDCVVLLHGLARTSASMKPMEKTLKANDFNVVNWDYGSTKNTISKLAETNIPSAVAQCEAGSTIHFVTHSMGGILVRFYLSRHTINNLGRVVMLGPPNQGSEIVDVLGDWVGYSWLNGPAGNELGTEDKSVPNSLGIADFDVGIIAGNRSINLILSQILPGPDDGKVTVDNTKLNGMMDHIVLPIAHPFMMRSTIAISQTIYFLKNGCFRY